MSEDLVFRLRNAEAPRDGSSLLCDLADEAANEIERLRQFNDELFIHYRHELDENERFYKIVLDIYDVITNEGTNSRHHRRAISRIKRQWPLLWKKIEAAVGEMEDDR